MKLDGRYGYRCWLGQLLNNNMVLKDVRNRKTESQPVSSSEDGKRKYVISFRDLEVYQNSVKACQIVFRSILQKLPREERFDLRDQLCRSTKAIPRLIAEGYAKKHQLRGFQKYIDDAMGECNETIVGIEQCRDLYEFPGDLCDQLIDVYDKCARQLFKLALAWSTYKNVRRKPNPNIDTGGEPFNR